MNSTYSIKDFLEVKTSFAPSFSPDGSHISYLSNLTGTAQIYLIPTGGGEPKKLTDFEDTITAKIFSPTENVIAFEKASKGDENSQLYLLNTETLSIEQLTFNEKVRYGLGSWSQDGRFLSYSSNERNGKDFDIYLFEIATHHVRCIFDQGGWCEPAGFSPTGKYLAVRKNVSNVDTEIYLCNLHSNEVEHITPHTSKVFYGNPLWMPDESSFFLRTNKDREFIGLVRYEIGTKHTEYVLTSDWDMDGARMQKQGEYLLLILNEDGYNTLKIYDPHTLETLPFELPKGEINSTSFSEQGDMLAFTLGDATHTGDVWTLNLKDTTLRQVTVSAQGVPPEILVEPELIRFNSFDELSVPAFVYRPKNIAETPHPVIINIHGGPEAQYQPSLALLTQYFVYNGYIVVAPNVRGSTGYGKTYETLDNIEKRLDSVKDIVALREHLVSLPEIDCKKIVLMGGSYGGFMVLAGLAFYPELWAAGVDTVGIVNFVTFLENTAEYRRGLREAEYGSLEHDRAVLEKISPINSVEHIAAPLFVLHGANDPRVPLSEAEQVVSKLKELGRDVELQVYQDEGHGLKKLKNRLDAYPKVVAFLSRVLNS